MQSGHQNRGSRLPRLTRLGSHATGKTQTLRQEIAGTGEAVSGPPRSFADDDTAEDRRAAAAARCAANIIGINPQRHFFACSSIAYRFSFALVE